MQVERAGAATLRVTAHAYELATLLTASRWLAEHRPDDLPTEALEQLDTVLASFDRAMEGIDTPSPR